VESALSPGRPTPLVKLQRPSEFLNPISLAAVSGSRLPSCPRRKRWTSGCSRDRTLGKARKPTQVSSLELPPSFRERRKPSGRYRRIRPKPRAFSSSRGSSLPLPTCPHFGEGPRPIASVPAKGSRARVRPEGRALLRLPASRFGDRPRSTAVTRGEAEHSGKRLLS
jgi:hypothetical protein